MDFQCSFSIVIIFLVQSSGYTVKCDAYIAYFKLRQVIYIAHNLGKLAALLSV